MAVPDAPAASFSLVNPRSCLGGAAGAAAGIVMYSCGTSAPATDPLLVTVHVTVATSSYRSARPPGATSPDAGPALAVEVILMSAKVKLV